MAMESIFRRNQARRLQQIVVGVAPQISRRSASGFANRSRFRSRREISRRRQRSLHALFSGYNSAIPISPRALQRGQLHRPAKSLLDLRQQGSRSKTRENAGNGRKPPLARRPGGNDRPEANGCHGDPRLFRAAKKMARRTERRSQSRLELALCPPNPLRFVAPPVQTSPCPPCALFFVNSVLNLSPLPNRVATSERVRWGCHGHFSRLWYK